MFATIFAAAVVWVPSAAQAQEVSLKAWGYQKQPGALAARVMVLKVESQDGQWSPAELGFADKRTFARHGRGELVAQAAFAARSSEAGRVELMVRGAKISGAFREGSDSRGSDINTVGLRIEFENAGADADVWVCAPCLTAGAQAVGHAPPGRKMVPFYRHLPRTIQKLWKGQPIHIVVMGSSIDRGSANPPQYLYDEDVSVCYADRPDGGVLKVLIDDQPRLEQQTNTPFVDQSGGKHYWENRKGVLGLPYGLHTVRLEAADRPVSVLGIFVYDSRSNRGSERRLLGYASPGETLAFSPPFAARPVVICQQGLRAASEEITPAKVAFSGEASGTYEIIGQ